MAITKVREPFDISFHIATPGVPVTVRYRTQVIETSDDGKQNVLQESFETDCQASPADVRKYLGEALAAGREEEQRAIASERAALAKVEALEGKDEDRA